MSCLDALTVILVFGSLIEAREFIKCEIGNTECQRNMYQNMLQQYAGGIPEWDLPNIGDMELRDLFVNVGDVMDFTIVQAIATGARICDFVELKGSIQENFAYFLLVCKFRVDGKFKVASSKPVIKEKLGVDSISGEGDGVLDLGVLNLHLHFVYFPVKHEDGNIYLKDEFWKINHTHEFTGNATFSANDLIKDNKIANDYAVNLLNENAKDMVTGIGDIVVKNILHFLAVFCKKFFNSIPASEYLIGDLTPYLHIDKLVKCRGQDEACLKQMMQIILNEFSNGPIPELDLPEVDPYHARDFEIDIPDLLDIKLIDAEITGLKDCVIPKQRAVLDISCSKFTITGEYRLSSFSATIKQIFGSDSIHGHGNAKVKFENIIIKLTYAYEIKERDGEIYFNSAGRSPDLDYVHVENADFEADSIYLGKENASRQIVDFVNKNWKLFETTVGTIVGMKLSDIAAEYVAKLFNTYPASTFIDDDLAAYARH